MTLEGEKMKERKDWPQVMIDHILKPEPLDYDEMEWASPLAGMTGFKSLLIFQWFLRCRGSF